MNTEASVTRYSGPQLHAGFATSTKLGSFDKSSLSHFSPNLLFLIVILLIMVSWNLKSILLKIFRITVLEPVSIPDSIRVEH